jgi:hypothetical protein
MYIFVDEAGELSNFTASGSRYFILCAVSTHSPEPLVLIDDLRYQIELDGFSMPRGFHAKHDPRPRRTRVFEILGKADIEIDAVALEKCKLLEKFRTKESIAYGIATRLLFKYMIPERVLPAGSVKIVFATYGTGQIKESIERTVRSAIGQCSASHSAMGVAFWDTQTHSGLQIADYCAWAAQRHLELNDADSQHAMNMLGSKFKSLFQPFVTSEVVN